MAEEGIPDPIGTKIDKMSFLWYRNHPDDREGFHYFLNHHWDYVYGDDMGAPLELYEKYIEKLHYPKKNKENKYVFITIQDFKRRHNEVEKLETFIKRIAYMYDAGFWAIESGKQKKIEDCNYHIHLLVQIKKKIKNHKQVLNAKWTALFDTDLRDKDYYLMKQWRKSKDMPSYEDWVEEKKNYFTGNKLEHSNSFESLHGTF